MDSSENEKWKHFLLLVNVNIESLDVCNLFGMPMERY